MPNRLKQSRERRAISQAELARQLNVSRQALSAIEAQRQDPSLELALKISRALNLPLHQLFYLEESEMQSIKAAALSDYERVVLVNQYRLLQAAHKDDDYMAKYYQRMERIFENGYVELYSEAFSELCHEVPREISDEVFAILDMHRAMLWSLGEKPDPVDVERVKFLGFDANNEGEHLGFAKFFTADGDKYPETRIFNSHHSTLPRYRKMLAEWDRMNRSPRLSKEQINGILEAGTFRH